MTRLPMLDALAEIRRIYFKTTKATIERDFERALDLLKTLGSEEERSRATVFMHGLAQMRSEWKTSAGKKSAGKTPARPGRPPGR